jgi:hypothetical protein
MLLYSGTNSLVYFPSGTPVFHFGLESLFGGFFSNSAFQFVTFSNETDVLTVCARVRRDCSEREARSGPYNLS